MHVRVCEQAGVQRSSVQGVHGKGQRSGRKERKKDRGKEGKKEKWVYSM